MKALVIDAPGNARVEPSADLPVPGPGEVRVAVRAAGVCAGDLYIYQGKNPYAAYPVIAGHEIAGHIEALGPDANCPNVNGPDVDGPGVSGPRVTDPGVPSLAVGELVVVEPFLGCGTCYPCRRGKSNCCAKLKILGIHRAGGYAQFVVAPATHIHRVPTGMSASLASFAEPVAIGVQACRRGEITDGDHVLVMGCGPIGLALIEVARARGATVIAADVSPARLDFARQLGAHTLPSDHTLPAKIMELTNGEGMPVVIEATGVAAVMRQSAELVAAGGRVVIVGLVKKGTEVAFEGLDFTRKEMTLVGSRASANCFPEALALLASGKVTYPRVATEFSMWDGPQVLQDLTAHPGKVHKAVLLT